MSRLISPLTGRRRGARAVTAAALAACAVAGGAPSAFAAGSARSPLVVTAAGRGPGAVTSRDSLGLNTSASDAHLMDPVIPGLLNGISTGVLRYPGGSAADTYDWATNSSGGTSDATDYAQFGALTRETGSRPLITVNYGSGTPSEAAAWVKDAASVPTRTPLWEIGNEIYGPWEVDNHPDPHTPQSYATYSSQFISAMRAADPRAQIGVPYTLTAEQAAGTGIGVTDPEGWNKTVLKADGSKINFVDMHWYPVWGTPTLTNAQIMATVQGIPSVMRGMKADLAKYSPGAKILIGETSISQTRIPADTQPIGALASAATVLEFLSQGADSIDWWDLHNSATGVIGALSAGTAGEPPVNTPLPTYYGYQMASVLAAPGSRVTSLSSPGASVLAYDSKRGSTHSVLLINSGDSARTVAVRGLSANGGLRTYNYSAQNPTVTQGSIAASAAHTGVSLPPESMVVLTTAK